MLRRNHARTGVLKEYTDEHANYAADQELTTGNNQRRLGTNSHPTNQYHLNRPEQTGTNHKQITDLQAQPAGHLS